jgi:hypothetical protein
MLRWPCSPYCDHSVWRLYSAFAIFKIAFILSLVDGEVINAYTTFPRARYWGTVITGSLTEIRALHSRIWRRGRTAVQVEINVHLVLRTQPSWIIGFLFTVCLFVCLFVLSAFVNDAVVCYACRASMIYEWMSTECRWNGTDRGKLEYPR